MNKIIVSGCSFTHAENSWGNYLKTEYDVTNVAEGGASNEMNIRNSIINILKNNYTHCIVQLSGINRFEVVVDDCIDTNNNFLISNKNYTWIKSTGDQEWWHNWAKENNIAFEKSKTVTESLNNYIKHCYSENQQLLKTLMSIVLIQNLCKQKQIKQLYFCWKNEFEQYLNLVKESTELSEWWEQIDWSQFWFHNQYDGLSEWGIDHNYTGMLSEDHVNNPPQGWLLIDNKKTMIGHPSTECHQMFSEKIIKTWIKENE